jgi:hypothetical protein
MTYHVEEVLARSGIDKVQLGPVISVSCSGGRRDEERSAEVVAKEGCAAQSLGYIPPFQDSVSSTYGSVSATLVTLVSMRVLNLTLDQTLRLLR